jgi:predicted cupin superfamily sugar epimerase
LGGCPAAPLAGEPVLLGGDLSAWQQPQVLIPGGTWQCAEPAGQQPVLVSCVAAPGFEFEDFRLADGPDAAGPTAAGPPGG